MRVRVCVCVFVCVGLPQIALLYKLRQHDILHNYMPMQANNSRFPKLKILVDNLENIAAVSGIH